jgi:hypothetical protein
MEFRSIKYNLEWGPIKLSSYDLKVCQHIKVCDEIDFDSILFDLALW